jgi:hypothetical protein
MHSEFGWTADVVAAVTEHYSKLLIFTYSTHELFGLILLILLTSRVPYKILLLVVVVVLRTVECYCFIILPYL